MNDNLNKQLHEYTNHCIETDQLEVAELVILARSEILRLEYENAHDWGAGFADNIRPLTPDEVPALKVAIEALEAIATTTDANIAIVEARTALARIKELTNER